MLKRILMGSMLAVGLSAALEARQMMCGGGNLSGNSGILYYHAGTDAQGHDLWKIARDANGSALTCDKPGTKFDALAASTGNRPSGGVLAERLIQAATGRPSGERPRVQNIKEMVTSPAGAGGRITPLYLDERVYSQLFSILERSRRDTCKPPNEWNGFTCVDSANPRNPKIPKAN